MMSGGLDVRHVELYMVKLHCGDLHVIVYTTIVDTENVLLIHATFGARFQFVQSLYGCVRVKPGMCRTKKRLMLRALSSAIAKRPPLHT